MWVRAGAEGVVIAARRKEVLDKTAAELESLSKGSTKVLAIPTDISKEAETQRLFDETKKTFGRTADVVLSNAAMTPPKSRLHEQSEEDFKNAIVSRIFYISVFSAY